MTFRKYLVLLAIVFFGAAGDVLLSRGMRSGVEISVANWQHAFTALANPWVIIGTVCLIAYFAAYVSALSWADLTYVLPATAIGYVVIALMAHYFLGEYVSLTRWAGIILITIGVGFVAVGPSQTERPAEAALASESPVPIATGRTSEEEQA